MLKVPNSDLLIEFIIYTSVRGEFEGLIAYLYPAEKETSNKLRARWVISKEKEPLEQFHYTLLGQLSTPKIDLFI